MQYKDIHLSTANVIYKKKNYEFLHFLTIFKNVSERHQREFSGMDQLTICFENINFL